MSNGSIELIEIGQPGFQFRPFVVGGHASLPSPGGLVYGPEWTMLNILTDRLKLSTHEARVFALASIAAAPSDLRDEYIRIIFKCCQSETIRHALEELMRTTFNSPFFDAMRAEFRAEGLTEGRTAGRAEGLAEGLAKGEGRALLAVLKARGFATGKQAQALISSCRDADQLELWATRAVTATTIDEVFAT